MKRHKKAREAFKDDRDGLHGGELARLWDSARLWNDIVLRCSRQKADDTLPKVQVEEDEDEEKFGKTFCSEYR